LNYGSPDKPEVFWELVKSADGIAKACEVFATPVISGNVSLYNETDGKAIYPTPMIGMVGLIEDHQHITTQSFKIADDLIYLVGETYDDFNGSELQKMQLGKIEGDIEHFDLLTEQQNQESLLAAIQAGVVTSAHDCSEGGLAVALAEATFGTQLGLDVTVNLTTAQLFSETQSRFVVTILPEDREEFERLMGEKASYIGKVTESSNIVIQASDGEIHLAVTTAKKCWEDAIECLMK
jgi:phosphoribosylformylglycinamidine synthase